jgi:HD-GYP domain-containing protein (c-di-GMP phosphodiesterase class II)
MAAGRYDTSVSDRPYCKANTFAAARTEIERRSGMQLDPRVVESYLSMTDQFWKDLRTEPVFAAISSST